MPGYILSYGINVSFLSVIT